MGEADLSKQLQKELSKIAEVAQEEELRRHIFPLSEKFEEWKAERLTSVELSNAIRAFHTGPAREIDGRYNGRLDELMVPSAISRGIIDKNIISPKLLEALTTIIRYYEENRIQNSSE